MGLRTEYGDDENNATFEPESAEVQA
jgi:putative mRNA 3-end processing factor